MKENCDLSNLPFISTELVIKIQEKSNNYQSSSNKDFYSTDNTTQSESSGFKPIVVSYTLIVTFEILN